MEKKTLYLICNAHLDPVWLWNMEEGISAALSTFHTAADFCENYDGFVFNHNEALLYQWIEEYDLPLFERIQKLVKAGKWHIMGGWYLQPDCNMPSGESFVRQIRSGQEYFREKFGVTPKTAINFDPFGHSRGLVQILKKAGYHSYLFGRPSEGDCPLGGDDIIWEGFDGSLILGHRTREGYNSLMGEAGKKVREKLEALRKEAERTEPILLWGVGNHGGGPSRQDMADIAKLMENEKEWTIVHGIPEDYFEKEDTTKLPVIRRDLNPWAVGCYTSQIRTKQNHRRLEGLLTEAEKMASEAVLAGVMTYPAEELADAEKSLMFSEFHDILPGSAIQSVEEQALGILSHGAEIADRVKRRAYFSLLSREKKAGEGEYPILAYNPHPWPVKGVFTCEFQLRDQNWSEKYAMPVLYQNGQKIPSQVEKEECNMNLDWRKKVAFEAVLPPASMTRISAYIEWLSGKPDQTHLLSGEEFIFRGEGLEAHMSRKTGFLTALRVDGKEYLKGDAGRLKVLKSDKDPWGMNRKSYRETEGYFELLTGEEEKDFTSSGKNLEGLRIIEDGEVRTVVEAVFGYGRSRARLRYSFPKHGTAVELEAKVEWLEKGAILKLELPTVLTEGQAFGETAFGVQEHEKDGLEKVSHRWNGLFDFEKDMAVTLINDGTYGISFVEGCMESSMVHSAAYAAHPIGDLQLIRDDRALDYIDQGERTFHYIIEAGSAKDLRKEISSKALSAQEAPMLVNAFPAGKEEKVEKGAPLALTGEGVILPSLHRTSDGTAYVVRLAETCGRETEAELHFEGLSKVIRLSLGRYEVKTLRISPEKDSWEEGSILE